ncbi:MAG: hypothetical protein AAF127_11460 [Pseudomonadota bacterium]
MRNQTIKATRPLGAILLALVSALALAGCSGPSLSETLEDWIGSSEDSETADPAPSADATAPQPGDPAPVPASDTADEPIDAPERSTEKLRAGLPIGMGSAHFMCQRTLSIVGEHCGCMVNRATNAGIADARQARMFGGRRGNASAAEAATFKRIVNECSGYNVTVQADAPPRVVEPEPAPAPAPTSAAPRRSQAKGRRVGCYFGNGVYEYDGACDFVAGPGGDFVATSLEGPYFEGVTQIGLDVVSKGVGNLVIYYPGGVVQQTRVRRSTRDKSCWEAARLTFCAR